MTYSAPARYAGHAKSRSSDFIGLGADFEADQGRDDLVEPPRGLGAAGSLDPVGHHLGLQGILDRGLGLRREGNVLHALLDALVDSLLVPALDHLERLCVVAAIRPVSSFLL